MRNALLIACCIILAAPSVLGGRRAESRAEKTLPLAVDDGSTRPSSSVGYYIPGLDQPATLTWIAVDTMANAFGPASRGIKPIAYDSATNIVALIHRAATSYGQSSGELWYNISRDAGATWRRVGALNSGVELLSRYPSCAISNPTNSSDTSTVLFVYAAPQLLAGGAAFGRIMYGVDYPIGANAALAFQSQQPDESFWSNVNIWTANASPVVNWVIYRRGTVVYDDLYRFRTVDFSTIEQGVPPTWAATNFNNAFGLDIRGQERNGRHYFGKWGQWTGDLNQVDNPGYSVSTDGGATWSAWTRPQPDFRSIPGIGGSKDWWTYGGPGAYSFDMVVDANNRVHFFGVIVDTATLQRDLVEIYETGTGWASKMIKSNLNPATLLTYATLNQMGNHINASTNRGGNVMAVVWLDAAPGDTLPDIWFSWRRIDDASWATARNLTETPGFAELLLHAAPTLKTNSPTSYTMFLGRSYEAGVTTYPPNDVNRTVFYAAAYTFTLTDVPGGKEGNVPQAFVLSQNYPNPFNPATKISFTLPVGSDVTLKVYNMLGQEVATVVNGYRSAGTYEVEFNAAGLASGVYYYTLRAGSFTATRKMLLTK